MERSKLRLQGARMRERVRDRARSHSAAGARISDFLDEVVYVGVWQRPGLPMADRMLCTLAALSPLQRLDALERHIGPALDLGLTPEGIVEIFLQSGLYAGFVTSEASTEVAQRVFDARGVTVPPLAERTDPLTALDERGREIMAALHGARGTGGYAAPDDPVTGALYPAAIRWGYGELWDRPGLDRRQRMLVAVAAFTALGLEGQVLKFGQSALNVGLSRAEVIEAIIQTGPYGGFPRALNALALLSPAFR